MAAQDNLKCFAIAGRTASGAATAVDDVDQEELRLPLTALLTPGYLPNLLTQAQNPNAFRVRQNTGTDMNLLVGSGTTKVDGYVLLGSVAGQGAYIIRLDATTKTVAVPATDPTNPARYGVYAFIDDTAYSGDASRAYANVTCIRGTPAGSPVTPTALAAWSASALLWEFQLPANATAVTNTILDAGTDRRVSAYSPVPQIGTYTPTVTQSGSTIAVNPSSYARVGRLGFISGSYTVNVVGSANFVFISLPSGWTTTANLGGVGTIGFGAGVQTYQLFSTGSATVVQTAASAVPAGGSWYFNATVPLA
jgi:hypothetical protein